MQGARIQLQAWSSASGVTAAQTDADKNEIIIKSIAFQSVFSGVHKIISVELVPSRRIDLGTDVT